MTYYSRELGEKNFRTMNEVLKVQRDMIEELQLEVQRNKGIITQQHNTINSMQQKLNVVFAKAMGNGATQ